MPFGPPSDNPYQLTRCSWHKNSLKQANSEPSTFVIPPDTHPKSDTLKTIIHYQYPLEFILSNMLLFFLNSTKITCQTNHLHEYWQWIRPSCCCCIFHEPSTCRNWTQTTITYGFILPWRSMIPPRVLL